MNLPVDRGLSLQTTQSRERLALLWTAVAIMALSGILLFFELGSSQVLRRHEAYLGVSAREMLASGDWITPTFGGHPRLEKPPLGYWLVAGLGLLQGRIDEWTVRYPAALSALILVALMGFWGTRWYGSRVGLSAAFIAATSCFTIVWGRIGVVDMALTLLMTASLYFFAEFCCQNTTSDHRSLHRGHSRLILAYCLVSLSSLAKPAFGLILVLGACAAFLLLQRRYRELFYLANPFGLAIAVLFTFVWPYLVSRHVPQVWEVMFTETVAFASGTTYYREPFWFYAGPVLFLIAPWTPLIIAAAPSSWRRAWRGNERERFLWVWFFSQLFALSLSVGKSPKYILPVLPALCLIGAQRLGTVTIWLNGNHGKPASVKPVAYLLASSFGILVITVIALSRHWPDLVTQWRITAAVSAAGFALAASFWMLGARRRAVWTIVAASVGCYLIVTATVVPYFDTMRSAAQFAQKAAALTPPQGQVVVYGLDRPPITFYLTGEPAVEESLAAIQTRLAREKSLYVVTGKNSLADLKSIADVSTLFETEPRFKSHVDYQRGLALVKMTLGERAWRKNA
jgi:4-amino-4-deoxy-L-arabinose transferase-like glycosyltransferase